MQKSPMVLPVRDRSLIRLSADPGSRDTDQLVPTIDGR